MNITKELMRNLWGINFFDICFEEALLIGGENPSVELVLAIAIGKIIKGTKNEAPNSN